VVAEKEMKREMAETIIEDLLMLKETYHHIDGELTYDIENLIAEYEEFC
jgi:hypothetical protein